MKNTSNVPVVTSDHQRGIIDVSKSPLDGSHPDIFIKMENGLRAWVPFSTLKPQEDGSYLLPVELSQLPEIKSTEQIMVIPVIEERPKVGKRTVETGKTRITKKVQQRTETVDEPLFEEQVEIERVPMNKVLEKPVSIRQEGDVTIIPLIEEELVVQKRLVLREEVRIKKVRKEAHHPQEISLRSEKAEIEHIDLKAESTDQE